MSNPNPFANGSAGSLTQIANALQAQSLQNGFTQSIFNGWLAGVDSFKQTPAESAAGVTPVNFAYPSHVACGYVLLERYGGIGNGLNVGGVNDTAFANAILVAGQIDGTIGITMGTTGLWLFGADWNLSGTGQFAGGVGPPVGGAGATGARVVGLGFPRVKFTGVSASTDLVTLGGTNLPQVEVRNIDFDANLCGRDGLVIAGSNMPIVDNVAFANTVRDSYVVSCSGSAWMEKGKFNCRTQNAGRHGLRFQLAGSGGAYINETIFDFFEVRGCAKVTAGGTAVYFTSTATGAGSAFGNIEFRHIEWDCQYNSSGSPPIPSLYSVICDSGNVPFLEITKGTIENTGGTNLTGGAIIHVTGTGQVIEPYIKGLVYSAWSAGLDNTVINPWYYDFVNARTQLVKIASVATQPTALENQFLFENDAVFGISGIKKTQSKGAFYAATFTVAPSGTGGNLTAIWIQASGSYLIAFSDGENRLATLTNGSVAVSWTNALTGAPTVNATITATPGSQTDGVGYDGFLHSSVNVATSSTGNLDFTNAIISPAPSADFPYMFTLMLAYRQFAASGVIIHRDLSLRVWPDGTFDSVQIIDDTSANTIASIAYSVVNSTTVRIAITTGTAYGTGGGNTVIYGTLARGSYTR